MKAGLHIAPTVVCSVFFFLGCGSQSEPNDASENLSQDEAPLAEAGKTPEATLRAYFHYKDRGDTENLRTIVAQDSLSMLPAENTQGMPSQAQKLRGIVVDHAEEKTDTAILYYRSWFSRGTKARGGRPYVAKLVKEGDRWKFDIQASLQLMMAITKGKDNFGFYDGTKEWWK